MQDVPCQCVKVEAEVLKLANHLQKCQWPEDQKGITKRSVTQETWH